MRLYKTEKYGGPQLSWQNQKPHGKNKNITAKPKPSRQKQIRHSNWPNTSRQKQITTAKPKLFCFCCEVFGFAVRYFVLALRFWFCCEVFCFCRDVFVLAVRFLVLPWQLWATILKRVCCHSLWIGSKLQSSCQEPITTGTLEVTNLLSTVFVDFVKSYSWKSDCDSLKQWDWSSSPCLKSTYS